MKFEWSRIFLHDLQLVYAAELLLRSVVMFVMVLIILRLTGKRGVRQLSLFEVAIIISFGSAGGDAMFQKDLGLATSLIVLATIMLLYRIITWVTARSEKVESLLEGDPCYVVEDGMFVLDKGDDKTFAKDEFHSEMRQQSIEHLGQVRTAILETNGVISFFYYEDKDVKYGMPVLPKPYGKRSPEIPKPGIYACTNCGHVEELHATKCCGRCDEQNWVEAINTRRVT